MNFKMFEEMNNAVQEARGTLLGCIAKSGGGIEEHRDFVGMIIGLQIAILDLISLYAVIDEDLSNLAYKWALETLKSHDANGARHVAIMKEIVDSKGASVNNREFVEFLKDNYKKDFKDLDGVD